MSTGRSTSPEGEIKNYSDLYDEKYYEYLKRLDFSSKGPGRWNTGKDMNWGEYITFSCSEFKESISIIIGNYNIYLKPEEIETFQSILDSDYMNFAVKVIPLLLTSNLKLADPHLFDAKDYNGTKQYLNLLRQLAEIFNSYCKEGDAINF